MKKAADEEKKLRDMGLKSATELYHKGVEKSGLISIFCMNTGAT